MSRIDDLERFYELIDRLRSATRGPRLLRDCSKTTGWPTHGVYFFFEDGEQREVGGPRIVRVGTHALSAGSKTTLWNRLSAHHGTVGGSRAGGGNHRDRSSDCTSVPPSSPEATSRRCRWRPGWPLSTFLR
jgi:hypothetical protein